MSGLLIVGAGGHAKVVAETAEAIGGFEPLVLADDRHDALAGTMRWPALCASGETAPHRKTYPSAAVAIGDAAARMAILQRLTAEGFALPVLLHPAAWVSPSAVIGEGSVVFAGAVIQAQARLGRGVIINTLASVDHDCVLADGVHVCPGAHLAGDVCVGEGSWLGIGCAVRQGVSIGSGVTVGAGAAVVADVADGLTVVGCPARPVAARR